DFVHVYYFYCLGSCSMYFCLSLIKKVKKMLREGQRLAHYRIMYRLRSGGMGEIYLADDLQLRRHVAIKVMKTNLSHYTDDEEAQEAARLFLREMQVIGQLEHQHI